jgi:hypothetical protein
LAEARASCGAMDALQALRPIDDRYATLPIADAFNWDEATASLGDGEWYLVAFRSIRRADADEARLELFDELAHEEAAEAPGFVHYYKGPLAADGSCLSFCLWTSRADARAAAGRPAHVRAVGLIDEMYALYALEFHRVRREADAPVAFTPYDGAPAHTMASPSNHPAGPSLLPSPHLRPATAT